MIRMQDLGELGYGSLVTLTEWWDQKRIDDGKITKKDILKKASTYGYLLPGGLATLTTAFGWMPALKPWDEHIAHGFIYDFPRFIKNVVESMREEAGTRSSAAVREAQRILAQGRRQTANRQLGAGSGAYSPLEEIRSRATVGLEF